MEKKIENPAKPYIYERNITLFFSEKQEIVPLSCAILPLVSHCDTIQYSSGTTAYMWIMGKIKEFADKIRNDAKSKLSASISDTPKHLVD